MKNNTNSLRLILLFPLLLLMGTVLIVGFNFIKKSSRQYSSPLKKADKEKEKNNDAIGMEQFFFNARKNSVTGKMDYAAMANSENTIATMQAYRATHRATGIGLGLSWKTMGPTNVGGRTRGILIDNQDPTGNTIFAAAVSGGIWKSTNGGATWDSINDNLQSLEACDLAQDANGVIYCGTGEGFNLYSEGDGFSVAMLGAGIFKSTDDGKTFTRLPSTVPSSANDANAKWAYTNRIAISPCNPQVIYAATNTGLFMTKDGGNTWSQAYNSFNRHYIGGNATDVKISSDGKVIVASINGAGFIAYPTCGAFDTAFTQIKNTGVGKLATGAEIEFAISPTNSNYMYASVVTNGANSLVGVYMSMNMGQYWHLVLPSGGLINPFGDQGPYDNTMAVFPQNPGAILVGGMVLWSWSQLNPTDTIGYWSSLSHYGGFVGDPDPEYIHPDEHVITFDVNHPNRVYLGCDGGIFKCTDIDALYSPTNPTTPSWVPMNRDYVTTQFYSIAFSPFVNTANGEGVMGGTQDNGTPYINGNGLYFKDQTLDVSSGDGGGSAVSFLNPNVFFSCTAVGNSFNRGSNLIGAAFPSDFYTTTSGLNKGANFDSIARGHACFVMPFTLYENPFDNNTIDSMLWVADASYKAGDTIHPVSPNGNLPFSYILPEARAKGDSLVIKNTVVSKIAAGFAPSSYVWLCMQAADLADAIVWMPIGGPDSKPDAFSDASFAPWVHCMTWSPDGDALFVGTEDGQLFRFSNLDSIRDSSYITGALMSVVRGVKVLNPKCRVHSKNMTGMFSGRDILSISVDPRNGNNMLVTLGNYGQNFYVYYSNNALSANPTFSNVQGSGATALPPMPVYASVLALYNTSNSYPKGAVVGTEHGVYSTQDITVANPVWTPDNAGAPNTLVLAMKQQTLPTAWCNNSGNIYMGTHGRGIYYTGSLGSVLSTPTILTPTASENMKVYPNPMSTQGTVDFTLAKEESITITVYDLQGRTVKTMNMGRQLEGQHLVPIQTDYFANGTYLVSVSGTSFRKTARIVVVK